MIPNTKDGRAFLEVEILGVILDFYAFDFVHVKMRDDGRIADVSTRRGEINSEVKIVF
jgi:hypothetical protein